MSITSRLARRCGELGVARLGPALGLDGQVEGKRTPVLRETRMPAVLFRLGPPERLAGDAITEAVCDAVARWVENPEGDPDG